MLTTEQIKAIEAEFLAGDTQDEVAARRGLSRQVLRYELLNSGKRVETYRRLVDTAPRPAEADGADRELAAA